MPDSRVIAVVERVRARMRVRNVLWSVTAGAATAGAVGMVAAIAGLSAAPRWIVALVAGRVMAFLLTRATWGATSMMAASLIERAAALDNLIVTTAELHARPRPVRSDILDEIERQADARLSLVDAVRVVPLRQPIAVAAAVVAGAFAVLTIGPDAVPPMPGVLGSAVQASTPVIDTLTVHVTPPAYSGRPAASLTDPVQVTVVAGSRIRLVAASAAEGVVAEMAGQPALTMAATAEGFSGEWVADRSTAVAIRPAAGDGRDAKFLSVIVVPDAPPEVRVLEPGKDLAITGTKGSIHIEVDAQDDLGLASLVVRFTKASGGGEALTFTEGEVPLAVDRVDGRHWRGRAEWVLDGLALADGDVLVYRAMARDRNPNGSPVQSDQYLVEVGRLAGAVGSGFALPAEEKKYAISQQMVIYKTEQLIASFKAKDKGQDWVEQNQLLAIEQRMVRAEVVFLGGGEVQDEVEEAAHSHELAEGRLENTGRAEMLRAINLMSQAEAQLNDGRAVEALALERQALHHLELAFDRRRYFLRTLPDRSRIDPTRRLTGNLSDARPWTRDRRDGDSAPALEQQRAVMRDLAAAASTGLGINAALAARVASLDPAEPSLQQAAVTLVTAAGDQPRRDAVWAAMQAVTAHALKSMAATESLSIAGDPLAGHLADALARPGKGGQ
ncbi:MAG: hypothetical protein AB7N29_04510 [Vicinamibacterales bacterium]